MGNKKNRIGMLAMVLVFGMMIAWNLGAQTDNRLNGTWVALIEGVEIKNILRNGNFEISANGVTMAKGTYTTGGNKISAATTHLHGGLFGSFLEPKLYSVNDLKETPFIGIFLTGVLLSSEIAYTLSGNTLTMTTDKEGTIIFTGES